MLIILLEFLIPLFIACLGYYFDPHYIQFEIFQRSGSLLVVIGLIIEIKHVIRTSNGDTNIIGTLTIHSENDKLNYNIKDTVIQHIGFIWILSGTLIWGFGDLLN